MTTRKNNKIHRALKRKGFENRNRDHKVLIFYHDGKKTQVHTKVSHSNKEISDILMGKMADQLYLDRKQFNDLIDCPLSKEKLIEIYKEQELI